MLRRSNLRLAPGKLAPRIDQVNRVNQTTTLVALITSSVFIGALGLGTGSFDESIGQETGQLWRVQLLDLFFNQHIILIQMMENLVDNLLLLRRTGPAKVIGANVEPFVN